MNAKRKGNRQEHKSIALLEKQGYKCTRAAASLGAFDIIAIGPETIQLVQVKTRDWPGTVEMKTIRDFPCPPNCLKTVHRWRDGCKEPDIRMVEASFDVYALD